MSLDAVIAQYPQLAYEYLHAAMVHVARGDLARAREVLRAGAALTDRPSAGAGRFPANGLHWLLGLVELAAGDASAAIREFDRELAQAGRSLFADEFAMDACDGLAFARLQTGDAEGAAAMFEQALTRSRSTRGRSSASRKRRGMPITRRGPTICSSAPNRRSRSQARRPADRIGDGTRLRACRERAFRRRDQRAHTSARSGATRLRRLDAACRALVRSAPSDARRPRDSRETRVTGTIGARAPHFCFENASTRSRLRQPRRTSLLSSSRASALDIARRYGLVVVIAS
jgi:tetratricopeptide (TPR) repeat protein